MKHHVEDVKDYPRPPALEVFRESLSIAFGGEVIAKSKESFRVLETFHPPTYYLPISCFSPNVLRPVPGSTLCEWKGQAKYFDIVVGNNSANRAAWTYPSPTTRFAKLLDHVAVYAEPMDACFVAGERVQPQPGNFYGGWVTSWITGPIKGAPGTAHW